MGANNADFKKVNPNEGVLTPSQLHNHVQGLLSSSNPVFGKNGSFKPDELSNLHPNTLAAKDFTYADSYANRFSISRNNVLRNLKHGAVASGECETIAKSILPHMPRGSKVIRFIGPRGSDDHQHWAIEVPTTEGAHVVDLTHSQFAGPFTRPEYPANHDATPFPLIEPKQIFVNRSTMKNPWGDLPEGKGLREVSTRPKFPKYPEDN